MDYFERLMLRASAEPHQQKMNDTAFDPFEQFAIDVLPELSKQLSAHEEDILQSVTTMVKPSIPIKEESIPENIIEKAQEMGLKQSTINSEKNIQPEKINVIQHINTNEINNNPDSNNLPVLNIQPEHTQNKKMDLLNTADQFMQGLGLSYLQPNPNEAQQQQKKLNSMNEMERIEQAKPMTTAILPIKPNLDIANDDNNSRIDSGTDGQSKHLVVSQISQTDKHEQSKKNAVVEHIIEKQIVIHHGHKTWNEVIQNSHSAAFGMGQL